MKKPYFLGSTIMKETILIGALVKGSSLLHETQYSFHYTKAFLTDNVITKLYIIHMPS